MLNNVIGLKDYVVQLIIHRLEESLHIRILIIKSPEGILD